MRIQFVSGTHAISTALFAVLRPGDEMIAVAGRWVAGTEAAGKPHGLIQIVCPTHRPYDTLEEVIGLRGTPGHGSLMEWGIKYRELPLAANNELDWLALACAVVPGACVAHLRTGAPFVQDMLTWL